MIKLKRFKFNGYNYNLLQKIIPDSNNEIKIRFATSKDIAEVMKSESDHLKFEVGDFYDSASNDRERDLSLSLNQRDRQKLTMIEDALNRIDAGTYGKCPYGNEVIDEERLRAMPFTSYCVSCMEDEATDNDF